AAPLAFSPSQAQAQLVDRTQAPNPADEGIALSLEEQVGAGQGDEFTPDSSIYLIKRDPARAIRRGRQLFQRKFTHAQGLGPRSGDLVGDNADRLAKLLRRAGITHPSNQASSRRAKHHSKRFRRHSGRHGGRLGGRLARKIIRALGPNQFAQEGIGDISTNIAIGAGLADSCAACHGRPRGSAGFGGDVATRPDSRDAPHLFGLGLQEQLADEMTARLREIRTQSLRDAAESGGPISVALEAKGISFGTITANADGTLDTSQVEGIDPDLRVRPFFAEGSTMSIREFVVGAFNDEMGLQSFDPCLFDAASGGICTTPAGMVLDGITDPVKGPPLSSANEDGDGDLVVNEIDPALVDFMEFYLLNYFKPGLGQQTAATDAGFQTMEDIGCTSCHVRDLTIDSDRRVADVETVYDPENGIFNRLFATAETRFTALDDGESLPQLLPTGEAFVVENIFTDFKRHDLGPNFYELNYDGSLQTHFITEPLWGVGSTSPYGHDGRSINLTEVILRHGGEAEDTALAFEALPEQDRQNILTALNSLILFPPDDTASNLNPGDPDDPDFPQIGHGSINLGALFQTEGPE
ncbi:MAG: di-heme oxidoredictase family protein, partial [Pseudomonadota bacterium]